jgi:DNA/RNA-binding domain of Phe-tRNA-synthetase-like protein
MKCLIDDVRVDQLILPSYCSSVIILGVICVYNYAYLDFIMILLSSTADWLTAHSGAVIGLLELTGVENTLPTAQSLNQLKRETEARLRKGYAGFTRSEFLALPVMAAYEQYYRRFDKTYHVLLQVESIVLKGKNLPDVSPLVDANFTAEVVTLALTAGHDAAKLEQPVVIDVSRSGDEITPLNGATKPIRAGDMVMRDRHGVCCTILYGQDNRSPITAATRHVLYVSYAPPGVPRDAVEAQLRQIEQNVRLFAPQAVVEQSRLLAA